MYLQEPKIEFVPLDAINTTTSTNWCIYGATSEHPSAENCNGLGAPMNDCPTYNTPGMMMDPATGCKYMAGVVMSGS